VLRGGSWNNNDHNTRARNRNNNDPRNCNSNNGLRVACGLKAAPRPVGRPEFRRSRTAGVWAEEP